MSRNWELFFRDMLEAAQKVSRYTDGRQFDSFVVDETTYDATLRNLEILGEAAKTFLRRSASAIQTWIGEVLRVYGTFWRMPTLLSTTRPYGKSFRPTFPSF